MKLPTIVCVAAALFAGSALVSFAKDAPEVTLTGTGQCAKCALHVAKACQNTVTVKQDGKEQLYYLAKNAVSEDFHDNICKGAEQIKVTGTVKEVDGKKEITASKIELVKS